MSFTSTIHYVVLLISNKNIPLKNIPLKNLLDKLDDAVKRSALWRDWM